MYYHTLYISQPTNFFNAVELVDLLKQSRENNLARGISGLLLYNKKYFCQYVEGDRDVVQSTVRKIDTDTRHKNLFVLSTGMTDKKLFPHWSMGFSDASTLGDLIDCPDLNSDFLPEQWNEHVVQGHEQAKDLILRFYRWSLNDDYL